MSRVIKPLTSALILLGSIGCDQATKRVAVETLKGAGTYSYLGDVFRLVYAENKGAFLGLGHSLPASWRFWLLTVGVGLMLVAAAAYLVLRPVEPPRRYLGALLFLSGGIGNWIDRALANGVVVDFMNMGIGGLRTGIFNVADLAIMGGAFLFAFEWPRRAPPPPVAAA